MRNLSVWDRFMLKMGAKLVKDPLEKKAMLTDFDHVKKEKVIPIMEGVKTFLEMFEPEMV